MNTEMTFADFEQLLAVYGSNRTRWPVDARTQAGRLVARSAEARTLLAEAEALDRALDRAPLPSLVSEAALAARIVAAAQKTPRVVSARAGTVNSPAATVARTPFSPRLRGWQTSAAGLVPHRFLFGSSVGVGALVTAASLALGILIGLSGLPQTVLRPVQQLTGLPVAATQASLPSPVDALDEDLL